MRSERAAAAYRQTHVASSPVRILEALLRRLLCDLAEAKRAIANGDVQKKSDALGHGLSIITELVAALDHRVAPELCGNLASLYAFAEARMHQASAQLDPTALTEAESVIQSIHSAFAEANGV